MPSSKIKLNPSSIYYYRQYSERSLFPKLLEVDSDNELITVKARIKIGRDWRRLTVDSDINLSARAQSKQDARVEESGGEKKNCRTACQFS